MSIIPDDTLYTNHDSVRWKSCRLGIMPERCSITKKILWPFTKVAYRNLTFVSNYGIRSKQFYCVLEQGIIENLKMK